MDCLFCKIVKGEIPSYKIWENEKFLAILDIFPNTPGQALVIPKEHYSSHIIDDMPDDVYVEFMNAVREVAKLIQEKLGVKRVGIIVEGTGVNHAHVKLYPMHGIDKYDVVESPVKVWFDSYPGYISSQMGLRMSDDQLKRIQEKFTS
ncbi:MAG TPA: HIT domain-containing protein [Candidatus Aenigmarchaeota archaeon]|nr:MAG: diadenosine tetraphosphate hydrolase [Nanoarchaeota archaeon]HDO79886.1 HIT domain-containing protein [Candidatus Aenigmarchaeota archaeon]HEX32938.1 HIT domain-containing protein [Candidatus Aenigmarchaeota archaeon]